MTPGNYTVRIRGQNGDEDSTLLIVHDYGTCLENQRLKPEEPMDNLNMAENVGNNENNLKFVKQVILEKKRPSCIIKCNTQG